jgi:hypothetical protein
MSLNMISQPIGRLVFSMLSLTAVPFKGCRLLQ